MPDKKKEDSKETLKKDWTPNLSGSVAYDEEYFIDEVYVPRRKENVGDI